MILIRVHLVQIHIRFLNFYFYFEENYNATPTLEIGKLSCSYFQVKKKK